MAINQQLPPTNVIRFHSRKHSMINGAFGAALFMLGWYTINEGLNAYYLHEAEYTQTLLISCNVKASHEAGSFIRYDHASYKLSHSDKEAIRLYCHKQ